MKVAVLGSGNGGSAVAFDWAKAGHEVYLYDFEQFSSNIDAINEKGGITSSGMLEGFQKLAYAGHDLEKTLKGAELIFVVGPAYSTEPFGRAAKPYLEKNQTFIICPSSCGGSIVFKNALGLSLENEDYFIAETSTLPYAVRISEPASINVFLKLKDGVFIAALPSKNTSRVYELVKEVYPALIPAKNVFQTTLQNANPVIHPSVTLLNAALIERTKGDFYFYEEGVTKAVGRLMKEVDNERIAIGEKLGFKIIEDPILGMKQGYMQEATYDKGYSEAIGFKGIGAQTNLEHRYLNEDVGYGLIFLSDLGKQIGVPTPTIDAVIKIASVIMEKDYGREKRRTMETLGLDKYQIASLLEIL
ncbi:NAD/NADP-dependent octopine/nopaline dehydrogenase family protein [Tissierella praeacuta]|uniref:NAD/NADP-dependent octopine/nopaline dehydrogenase family protein n=1 Tax=Tissierella praeacuta TaxID=43131 RepID=UPI001C11CCE0|nr:NAD/NADP-dependent octopine/nopaline dehydrogenase family protein [Tissierella praeacuta]MBU5256193.1 NAD/NADP octopine/nopaline dehydrogenase family protein [Tissierella praeacuta]